MAEILENLNGRRLIRVSTDDVISIVQTYQSLVVNTYNYDQIRSKLNKTDIYLPEDL